MDTTMFDPGPEVAAAILKPSKLNKLKANDGFMAQKRSLLPHSLSSPQQVEDSHVIGLTTVVNLFANFAIFVITLHVIVLLWTFALAWLMLFRAQIVLFERTSRFLRECMGDDGVSHGQAVQQTTPVHVETSEHLVNDHRATQMGSDASIVEEHTIDEESSRAEMHIQNQQDAPIISTIEDAEAYLKDYFGDSQVSVVHEEMQEPAAHTGEEMNVAVPGARRKNTIEPSTLRLSDNTTAENGRPHNTELKESHESVNSSDHIGATGLRSNALSEVHGNTKALATLAPHLRSKSVSTQPLSTNGSGFPATTASPNVQSVKRSNPFQDKDALALAAKFMSTATRPVPSRPRKKRQQGTSVNTKNTMSQVPVQKTKGPAVVKSVAARTFPIRNENAVDIIPPHMRSRMGSRKMAVIDGSPASATPTVLDPSYPTEDEKDDSTESPDEPSNVAAEEISVEGERTGIEETTSAESVRHENAP
jgi:hypothetical protein